MTTTAPTVRLAKSLGGQTSTIEIAPVGATSLAATFGLNGHTTDHDVAEFDSTAERDAAFTECVANFTAAGYWRAA
jgi:hypothetical protein